MNAIIERILCTHQVLALLILTCDADSAVKKLCLQSGGLHKEVTSLSCTMQVWLRLLKSENVTDASG